LSSLMPLCFPVTILRKLKEEGVDVIVLHMKTSLPFESLAKFLHYDKAEYNYSKYIGEK